MLEEFKKGLSRVLDGCAVVQGGVCVTELRWRSKMKVFQSVVL